MSDGRNVEERWLETEQADEQATTAFKRMVERPAFMYTANALVAIVLLVAGWAIGRYVFPDRGTAVASDSGSAAEKRFCDFASELVSVDYNSLDDYAKRLAAATTGEAAIVVQQNQASQPILDAVRASKVRIEVVNRQCGALSGDGLPVQYVAAVNARSTNAAGTRPMQYLLRGQMTQIDGRWLVSTLSLNQG